MYQNPSKIASIDFIVQLFSESLKSDKEIKKPQRMVVSNRAV